MAVATVHLKKRDRSASRVLDRPARHVIAFVSIPLGSGKPGNAMVQTLTKKGSIVLAYDGVRGRPERGDVYSGIVKIVMKGTTAG